MPRINLQERCEVRGWKDHVCRRLLLFVSDYGVGIIIDILIELEMLPIGTASVRTFPTEQFYQLVTYT